MAPLSDLPPMPPIPDDELTPPRRRLEPGKTARAKRSDPDQSERGVITVRVNRRLCWWVVSIGWPLAPAMFVLVIYLQVSLGVKSQLLLFVLSFPPLYAAMMGTMVLVQGNCLTYDVRGGWIGSGAGQVRSALNRWRDGDRFEYSIYLGRLERVRANGKRRSLARYSILLDRDSWTAFVDVFLAHQNGRAAGRENAGPSLDDRVPAASPVETPIAVSVRRRFFVAVLLVGLASAAFDFGLLADAERTGAEYDLFGPLALVAVGYFLFGALPLVFNPVLTFEPRTGRMSVKARGLPAREFPRSGGARFEYSVYNGVLYEVRPDGKRRRVATGWAREQVAWKAFVDRFLQDQPVPATESGE